jgi:hypothetical protein
MKAAGLEVGDGRRADVETSEVETGVRLRDRIDSGLELRRAVSRPVEENGAAAVRAELDQADALAGSGDAVVQPREVDVREAHGPVVSQDQVGQAARTISDDLGEALLGDRADAARGLTRVAVVEHSEFEAADIALHDGVDAGGGKVCVDFLPRARDDHARPTLADVRLQDDREFGDVHRFASPNEQELGHSRQVCQDRGLRFADKAAGRDAGIGGRKQGQGAMPHAEIEKIRDDGQIGEPGRPKLPADFAEEPPEHPSARMPG